MSDEVAVVRVHTEHGSHIEPPLDQSWTDLDKLRWHAAVVAADTGLRVTVTEANLSRRVRRPWQSVGVWRQVQGVYSVNVEGSSSGAYNFHEAWIYLNGVSTGAEQRSRHTPAR